MIGNILDNTTELYMIKYTFGEIFSYRGATLCENPSDQTASDFLEGMQLQQCGLFLFPNIRYGLAGRRTKRAGGGQIKPADDFTFLCPPQGIGSCLLELQVVRILWAVVPFDEKTKKHVK